MKRLLFSVMLFCIFTTSVSHAGGTGGNSPITYFHFYNGHIGLLLKQPAMINPDGCERSDLYMVPKTHPFYKELVALIMTAHMTGQPLTIAVQGCTQGMPTVAHVESFK